MRWFHLAVIIIFVAVILIFAFQNLAVVTVSFLGFSARAPLAVVIPIIYLLGAATGGSLIALLRRSYAGSKRGVAAS
ncbi:MAG TPA: hypothetical protein VKB42_00505 [Dongiaceae bacterium]|nr:hypothetical protein [Dongiaceae bacterium]